MHLCTHWSNLPITNCCFHSFILQNGRLQHNPALGCLTVLGSAGKAHVVKLFPSESCSCPATSQCYHILAVKMSVGISIEEHSKKVNLTQLCRNTRSRSEKKSGRKAPRSGNYFTINTLGSYFEAQSSHCLHVCI